MSNSFELVIRYRSRLVSFQTTFYGVQEPEGGAAVEDAVVEGDFEVHHAAYGDGVVYHDGAFDDGFCGEDRRLRVIDDGGRDHAAEGTGVVDGEGSSRDVCGIELTGAGAPHQVVDLAGEPEDVQLVGARDDGHDQGVFEVYGHADIYALSQDYAVPVPHGVEYGIRFEALDDGLYYERQVGELYALALGEGVFLPLAQGDEPAHVYLYHGPGVRSLAFARGHAVGYGAPDAAQVLDTVALVEGHAFGFREGFPLLTDSLRRVLFLFLYVAFDVLPGYASPCTCTRDLLDLDPVLFGEASNDRGGAGEAQGLGVFNLAPPVAIAACAGDGPLSLTILCDGLGFFARGGEFLRGSV